MAPRERPLIAVVNDDTSFLHLMEELIEQSEGYEVLTHKSWNAAYEFVKQADPDLVIVDIVMGDEERGWTLISMLTLDPKTRPTPSSSARPRSTRCAPTSPSWTSTASVRWTSPSTSTT